MFAHFVKSGAVAGQRSTSQLQRRCLHNSALVFLKPLACDNDNVKNLVKDRFKNVGIKIVKEARIDAKQIDEGKLIDRHYYAIASKATLLTPDKLSVPADAFKSHFGMSWADALKNGKALNATQAMDKLGVDAVELGDLYSKADLIKLGGGFYCGEIAKGDKGPYYVMNGFFMLLRAGFVEPGKGIHYYVVEWDSKDLSWADFRGKVLGPTDPTVAGKDTIRGTCYATWQKLGLPSVPNTRENCIHGSASPFEGLCEKMNWLGATPESDPFGKALLDAGIAAQTIKDWSFDCAVKYGDKDKPTTGTIFDTVEDMDADQCRDKCVEIAKWTSN